MNDRQQEHNAAEDLRHRTSRISKVETLLNDVDFPCTRGDLITHVRDKGASEEVMKIVEQFPDKQYASTADVARGLGAVH